MNNQKDNLRIRLNDLSLGSALNDSAEASLEALVAPFLPTTIDTDYVVRFGRGGDRVIEFVGTTNDGKLFEVGYYYGEGKSKNIVNVSPQAGCAVGCAFCELGDKPFERDLTPLEVAEQVALMLKFAKEEGVELDLTDHKINIAKSGDILFHKNPREVLEYLGDFGFSIKASTVFPRGERSLSNFEKLSEFASDYAKSFQIQLSLISTDEPTRSKLSGGVVAPFETIRRAGEIWRENNPKGRKINLSLILTDETPADPTQVVAHFPPENFRFRFRPYVQTSHGAREGLHEISSLRLSAVKESFLKYGYEVGDWATPTQTEQKFKLSSNSTLERYRKQIGSFNDSERS